MADVWLASAEGAARRFAAASLNTTGARVKRPIRLEGDK
jgi:hypothetical protein